MRLEGGEGKGHGRPGGLPDAYALAGRACRVVNPFPTQACSGTTRGRGGREVGPARWLVQPCRPARPFAGHCRARRHAGSGAGEGAPIQPLIPLPVLVALVSRGLLAEALRVDEDEEDEG